MLPRLLLAIAALLAAPLAHALGENEFLSPEQAFELDVEATGPETITARWTVADGYYLYRDKLGFDSATQGVSLGAPDFPESQTKHDQYFGEVEIYKGRVAIEVPVESADTRTLELKAAYQGCAEAGICYRPDTRSVQVKLPEPAPAPGPETASSPAPGGKDGRLARLNQSLGMGAQGDLLSPDEAFRFSTEQADAERITADWQIADGYYLYRDKIEFRIKDGDGVRVARVELPEGETKHDEFFGEVQIFKDRARADVTLERAADSARRVVLEATYQGCAEAGVCYRPETKTVSFDLPPPGAAAAATAADMPPPADNGAGQRAGGQAERFQRLLAESSPAMVGLYALGFGLLLAFTACMYPMIPILSGIIVGQGEHMSMARGFGLSLIYVLALALTFGVVGALMAWLGGGIGIQAYFQSPWLLIPFAALFVILALGMFGFFSIQIPSALQSRLSAISNRQRGGTLAGVAIMGILSALIIGPCGGPVLVAALAYAAAAAELTHGFLALFMLGLGMGLPLLVVGAGGGKLLPRAGGWMDTVKAVAGVILLAVALVILERMPSIFPPTVTMLAWSALLIVSAVFMRALSPIPEQAGGWRWFWKGLGVVVLLYGIVVMLGGLTGGKSVTDPLHGSALVATGPGAASGRGSGAATGGSGDRHASGLEFTAVDSVADVQRELAAAADAGKPALLDFYADWCTYCVKFERYVLPDPAVRQALEGTVLLRADVTKTDAEDKALMERFGVFLPPAILFFGPDGEERRDARVVGSMDAATFARHAGAVLESAEDSAGGS